MGPNLCKLHGLTNAQADDRLIAIVRFCIVLIPAALSIGLAATDPGDHFLWELLATRPDLRLVTGDKLLLQDLAK